MLNPKDKRLPALLVFAIAFTFPYISYACATCGCSLSSDAAMGYSAEPGWVINLQYDYINQNELRSGDSSISKTKIANINNEGGDQEVEKKTTTRYTNLKIAYSPNANWNIQTVIPYVDRSHASYGNATTNELTENNVSGGSNDSLGDMKWIGAYQGFLPTHNLGVQLGIKLPTGNYGGENVVTGATVGHHPVTVSHGPDNGEVLDTSLQAGTGSTDLIIGGYYYRPVSRDVDAFVDAQYQIAISEKLDQQNADFRPGNLATVSAGFRYMANQTVTPQMQLNITDKSHDQGMLADEDNTAGKIVYLSPGATVKLLKNTQLYSFVQLPVYSNVDGYQLVPRWTGSIGVSYAF